MINNETFKDWIFTFWHVVISPTPKTFLTESQKAENKFPSAVGWIVFFALYAFGFSVFIFKQVLITGFVGMVLILPITIILFSSAMHFVYQRIFKRKYYIYDKLIYLNTAILLSIQFLFVPISTLLLPVSTVTIDSVVSYGILLYQFILNNDSIQDYLQFEILAGINNGINFCLSSRYHASLYYSFPAEYDRWSKHHNAMIPIHLEPSVFLELNYVF